MPEDQPLNGPVVGLLAYPLPAPCHHHCISICNLSNNNLDGHLPDGSAALGELSALDISHNQLDGMVPVSWLEANNLLSHVVFMDVGRAWQESTTSTSWRQQLCHKESLYDRDVTGQQIAHLPSLRQGLPKGFYSVLDAESAKQVLADEQYVSEALKDALQAKNNQLASVRQICSNQSSKKVLLIAWLLCGAVCLAVLGAYR